jgi:hypothetical protein
MDDAARGSGGGWLQRGGKGADCGLRPGPPCAGREVNATVGFAELGAATRKSPKSLMRMLGPEGNPQARNLFEIVAYLQRSEGFRLTTRTTATVPEVRAPAFAEEAHRQSLAVARSRHAKADRGFIDAISDRSDE